MLAPLKPFHVILDEYLPEKNINDVDLLMTWTFEGDDNYQIFVDLESYVQCRHSLGAYIHFGCVIGEKQESTTDT